MGLIIQVSLLVLVCTMTFFGVWWLRGRGFSELRPARSTPPPAAGRSCLDISTDPSENR